MIIAVVGLAREARIVEGPDVEAVIGQSALDQALSANARGVISIGAAGGLDPQLAPGDCVVARCVIAEAERFATDETWTGAILDLLPQARAADIVGSDQIVATNEVKSNLFRQTGAGVVDMESHMAARAVHAYGLPFVALRVVLDGANFSLPHAALVARRPNGTISLRAVAGSLLADASQIPSLMRIGRDADIAFRALLRCRSALGPRLAFPYLG